MVGWDELTLYLLLQSVYYLTVELRVAGQVDGGQVGKNQQGLDVDQIVVGQVEGLQLTENFQPVGGGDGTIAAVEHHQLIGAGDGVIGNGLGGALL